MFVQIGNKAVNMDLVTEIWFKEKTGVINLYFQSVDESFLITGGEAEAFKVWWENKADVYKLPV